MNEIAAWCTCGAGEFQPPEGHAAPCPGSLAGILPGYAAANGTEPFVDSSTSGDGGGDLPIVEPEPGMPPGEIPAAGPPDLFTAPDKIVSVVQAMLAKPSPDPKVNAVLRVLQSRLARNVIVNPVLALLPPLDAPDDWDAYLAMLVGCALELASDGVEIDVDVARDNARQQLAGLFDEGAT